MLSFLKFWADPFEDKEATYVFLDVDGVLNNSRSWNTKFYIDENCVRTLAKIAAPKSIRIILTSTWRQGFDKTGENHSTNVQNLLHALGKYGLWVWDITPQHISGDRSKEVERYIQEHQVKKYVILDDDPSIFSNKEMNIYWVDYQTGLTEKDVKQIKKRWK